MRATNAAGESETVRPTSGAAHCDATLSEYEAELFDLLCMTNWIRRLYGFADECAAEVAAE